LPIIKFLLLLQAVSRNGIMLKKQSFKNKKSLIFGRATLARTVKVRKYIFSTFQVFILAVVLSVSYSLVFESPKEFALKLENAKYLKNITLIQNELDLMNKALSEIQEKDDRLYRMVLGVDPLSDEIRSAGIGGSSKKTNSDALPNDLKFGKYRNELKQLDAQLKVQAVSFDELTALATENINRIQHRPSIYPIAPDDLTRFASSFGYRTHPIFQIRKFHKGIDLTALKGTPVYATAKGRVSIATNANDGYGNKVFINHGYGYLTVYAHLHKINVKVGQEVNLGDLIGQVGNTGISVAPHLHYEVRKNDRPVNPLAYIYKDISSEEYSLITHGK